MKKLCKTKKIPTANFKICKNNVQVLKFLKESKLPIVVKADGLAAGKGVFICKNKTEVLKITTEIFKGKFKSSNKLILEEFLEPWAARRRGDFFEVFFSRYSSPIRLA